jgi:neutral amino acid transport system ATP-binding protein
VTEPILDVAGVVKRFGGLRAVNGAGFAIAEGSVTALIGPNGAGKTTLFNVLTGFYRADSGRIHYLGEAIQRKPPHAIARRGMVRTFQITKVLAAMSVLDNMLLAGARHPGERLLGATFRVGASRRREREVRERALSLLEVFNLATHGGAYAGTLSGGQRKLLELARALMVEPRLVLLDEPMAGVNPTLGRRLFAHIEELREQQGLTFLFVEHDMDVVMRHAERVIVMAEGRVLADGTPEAVRADPRVLDAYLGKVS